MQETDASTTFPKVNDRYETIENLGQGGMGIVYKAYDKVTRRYVAIKTLLGDIEPGAIELFEREWSVLARLSHPNIVDILDTGEFRDDRGQRKPFFVMPVLPGKTLDLIIRHDGQRLSVETVVEIMTQVCRGLQAAHDRNLVHRDLKPSNIFVMDDDTAKIIDFGVAHLADSQSITGIKGTLQYMSPEQIDLSSPISPRSDIFSLAVVCYEALTQRKPFARPTEGETIEAIRTHIPVAASEINGTVNTLVSRTVHKAMAKQPGHRFSSAKEFAETLQRALRNEPIERFDKAKIQPRIERIKKAFCEGDDQFAMEILTELEAEGHIDTEMPGLRKRIEQSVRQRTIRQLLESARTRMQSDEQPLALQKLAEVLAIDPANEDALQLRSEIERQRSEKQIEECFRLVEEHQSNQHYSQARQGLEEILKIDGSNTRARSMLAEIDLVEHELQMFREEMQRLYDEALECYQNGEFTSALGKLEQGLELSRRAGTHRSTTELYARYESFFTQLRSERDAARNAYLEGRRCLKDNNAARALEICKEFLQKYPNDSTFQALKMEAEGKQRQQHSGAAAEAERLRHSQEEQVRAKAKDRWMQQIDGHFAAGEYARARDVIREALVDFPTDKELEGLQSLAEQGVRLSTEAGVLFQKGLAFCEAKQYSAGLDALRKAERLDPRNSAIRVTLLSNLVEHARERISLDWRSAEALVQEANKLNADDPAVRGLNAQLESQKRQHAISNVVVEAKAAKPKEEAAFAATTVGVVKQHSGPVQPNVKAITTAASVNAVAPGDRSPLNDAEHSETTPKGKMAWLIGGVSLAIIVLALAATLFVHRRTAPIATPVLVAKLIKVNLTASEPGVSFKVDGTRVSTPVSLKPGEHTAEADLDGYTSDVQSFHVGSDANTPVNVAFVLRPILPELRFTSGLTAGSIVFDDEAPVDLQDGSFSKSDVALGEHRLRVLVGQRQVFGFSFTAAPHDRVKLNSPPTSNGSSGVVISSMNGSAQVYGTVGLKASLSGGPMQPIPPAGITIPFSNPPTHFSVSDEKGQTHDFTADSAAVPVLNVVLSGGVERTPITITANVATATVSVDGTALPPKLLNGTRALALPAGRFSIAIAADGYQPVEPQQVVIKAGDAPKHLAFQLTPIPQPASLTLTGAPPDAGVFIDDVRVGTVTGNGAFSKDINPGMHQLEVRKAGFDSFKESRDFKGSENVALAVQMRSSSTMVALHISPANAKITLRHDSDIYTPPNGQTAQIPPGSYMVTAVADDFKSRTETVQVETGRPTSIDWILQPEQHSQQSADSVPFVNASSWTKAGGWMVHSGAGVSIYNGIPGAHTIDMLKRKGKLGIGTKRIVFLADYQDKANYTQYTLDGHNLTRITLANGTASDPAKLPFGQENGDSIRMIIVLSADEFVVKNRDGKVVDTIKKSGIGRFGFQDDVELNINP